VTPNYYQVLSRVQLWEHPILGFGAKCQ